MTAIIRWLGLGSLLLVVSNAFLSNGRVRSHVKFELLSHSKDVVPKTEVGYERQNIEKLTSIGAALATAFALGKQVNADDTTIAAPETPAVAPPQKPSPPVKSFDYGSYKLPYFRENLPFKEFLGPKATVVFNMKIDDPQTVLQFPDLGEIYRKYSKQGLHVHAFPTEQGWFEPDDDETCRLKAKEFYNFGSEYPKSVVFDKVDILGPSAHPLYVALTNSLATPNGYSRITLNYEKFLLDSSGTPVRRYPRKYSAYDMEADIQALLNDEPLPEPSALYAKSWKEAKREVQKSEYAFRYNYNYYTAPESMYKYDSNKDKVT